MASNFSIIERVKYSPTLTRNDVLDMLEQIQQEADKRVAHVQSLEHTEESLREQLYFARELIDTIVNILEKETRSPKAIKSGILAALEDSFFER